MGAKPTTVRGANSLKAAGRTRISVGMPGPLTALEAEIRNEV